MALTKVENERLKRENNKTSAISIKGVIPVMQDLLFMISSSDGSIGVIGFFELPCRYDLLQEAPVQREGFVRTIGQKDAKITPLLASSRTSSPSVSCFVYIFHFRVYTQSVIVVVSAQIQYGLIPIFKPRGDEFKVESAVPFYSD